MLARLPQSDFDTGPRSGRPVTERLCVATRTVIPVTDMIRFVVAPDGAVVPDLRRKLPGRGIWITATRDAVFQAVKRKAIRAAFKREVRAGPELAAVTEQLLERAMFDALAIARKGSLAITGFAKVEAALAQGNAVALLHAAGAGADGVRKLDAAAQRRSAELADRIGVVADLPSEQLDLALARPNVVHAALLTGSATDVFLVRHARLMRFRTGAITDVNETRAMKRAED